MRSATFEAGDGKDFRFRIETRLDNVPSEDIDGKAKKTGGASSRSISPSPSSPRSRSTAARCSRPSICATFSGRRAAASRILEAKVYDGSGDGEKVFDTLTVIGKPTSGAVSEKAAQIKELAGLNRWPVAISYFEPGKRDEQPVYVLSFDLYENGVSRALKLDYGDFVLTGEMTELGAAAGLGELQDVRGRRAPHSTATSYRILHGARHCEPWAREGRGLASSPRPSPHLSPLTRGEEAAGVVASVRSIDQQAPAAPSPRLRGEVR